MKKILTSASKIVLIILTLGLVYMTVIKIIDPKDFILLTTMVFSFYFNFNGKSKAPADGAVGMK